MSGGEAVRSMEARRGRGLPNVRSLPWSPAGQLDIAGELPSQKLKA